MRRENDRVAPLEAVLHGLGAVAHGIIGPGVDTAALAGAVVLSGDEAVVGAGVDDFGIARVGGDPAAFAAAHVVPVVVGDAAAGGAAGGAHGGIVLLRAIQVIGEIFVERHAVELRGGLVIDAGPGASAVARDVGPAVVGLDHAARVAGRDPQVVVIAMRRS